MAFTDKCDIFASFHEDVFNHIIRHIREQRPSLFNYATQGLLVEEGLLCEVIPAHPIVHRRGNPLATQVDPLPIPGTHYGLNFAVQLVDVKIDFHPGDEFRLPPELSPPLAAQHFALYLRLCAGIACPSDDLIEELIPPPPKPEPDDPQNRPPATHVPVDPPTTGRVSNNVGFTVVQPRRREPIVAIPARQLACFCLDAFVVGHMVVETYHSLPHLEMKLDGFEIVDIKPDGLESSIECYIRTMLQLAVLPGMR
ncbi:hypothetical protein MJD09_06260, partial [bacterium]|nr:hypothetical protein [bacterium]